MKYRDWYEKIISAAKSQKRSKAHKYFESHHILPRALGGDNKAENLVLLTAREHFVCHLLLCRMFPLGSQERMKMLHAMMLMKGKNKYQQRYVSRAYEAIKCEYSSIRSRARAGVELSEEHKAKIAQSLMGHRNITDAGRARISLLAKTRKRKPFSDEARKNIGAGMRAARAARMGL